MLPISLVDGCCRLVGCGRRSGRRSGGGCGVNDGLVGRFVVTIFLGVAVVFDVNFVSSDAVGGVVNGLGASVGQENVIRAGGLFTVVLMVLPEMVVRFGVFYFPSVTVRFLGWLYFIEYNSIKTLTIQKYGTVK